MLLCVIENYIYVYTYAVIHKYVYYSTKFTSIFKNKNITHSNYIILTIIYLIIMIN
jgi:hypothetical protein